MSTGPYIDPEGALARADAVIAEAQVLFEPDAIFDAAALESLRAKLQASSAELAYETAICKHILPGWSEFGWKFAVGFGGIAFMPATFG